jgi:hypothetical protein
LFRSGTLGIMMIITSSGVRDAINCRVKTLIIFRSTDEVSCNEGAIRRGGDKCSEKRNDCDMIETLSITKLIVEIFLTKYSLTPNLVERTSLFASNFQKNQVNVMAKII